MTANQFTVTELPVSRQDGQPVEATYHLTRESASPSTLVGRDSLGKPIYEPVPTCHWAYFQHVTGPLVKVPLRTGSVFSMRADAVAYESETVTELLREGFIPIASCPYTSDFKSITGTQHLVTPPPGESDCGGRPEGCQHFHDLSRRRMEAFTAAHNAEVERMTQMDPSQAAKLAQQMTEALGILAQQQAREEDSTGQLPQRKRAPKGA